MAEIGFVFPPPSWWEIPHIFLSFQHLPLKTSLLKLGLFRTIALRDPVGLPQIGFVLHISPSGAPADW
jgi:hypothetical protein